MMRSKQALWIPVVAVGIGLGVLLLWQLVPERHRSAPQRSQPAVHSGGDGVLAAEGSLGPTAGASGSRAELRPPVTGRAVEWLGGRDWQGVTAGVLRAQGADGRERTVEVRNGGWSAPEESTGWNLSGGTVDGRPLVSIEKSLEGGWVHLFEGGFAELRVLGPGGSGGMDRATVGECIVVSDLVNKTREVTRHPGADWRERLLVSRVRGELRLPVGRDGWTFYWIGADGCSWRRVALRCGAQPTTVLLEPGTAVAVRNGETEPKAAGSAFVEVAGLELGEAILRVPLPPSGEERTFEGLPVGEYAYQLYSGSSPLGGGILEEGRVRLQLGEIGRITLSRGLIRKPPRPVWVGGRLLLPMPIQDLESLFPRGLALTLHPRPGAEVRQWNWGPNVVRSAEMVRGDPKALEWSFPGGVLPGHYDLSLEPLGPSIHVELLPGEGKRLDVVVPEPAFTALDFQGLQGVDPAELCIVAQRVAGGANVRWDPAEEGWICTCGPGPVRFIAVHPALGMASVGSTVESGWNEVTVEFGLSAMVRLEAGLPLPPSWWARLDEANRSRLGAEVWGGVAYPECPEVGAERAVGLLHLLRPGNYELVLPRLGGYQLPEAIDLSVVGGQTLVQPFAVRPN